MGIGDSIFFNVRRYLFTIKRNRRKTSFYSLVARDVSRILTAAAASRRPAQSTPTAARFCAALSVCYSYAPLSSYEVQGHSQRQHPVDGCRLRAVGALMASIC